MSIHRIRLCFGTVRCTCGQEAAFNVWDTDGDELEDMAWADAGFDELGNCPSCQRSQAAEESADRATRDRKARMEDLPKP
jgi:hypothetical protein